MANDVAPAGAFVLLRGMTRLTSAGGSSLPSRLFSLRSPCDPCPASWVEVKNAEDAGAELILENDRELAARSPGDIGGRSNNGDVGGTAEAMRGVARGGARGEKEGRRERDEVLQSSNLRRKSRQPKFSASEPSSAI
jgi:hypothetical protein